MSSRIRRSMARLAMAAVACVSSTAAAAAAAVTPATATATAEAAAPAALPGTVVREMRSRSGKEYRIFIATPIEQAPPNGWPVVYVLDGNAWFLPFAQQARLVGRNPDRFGTLPAVVVGIGYPQDAFFNMPRRVVDFTPPAPQREEPPEGWPAPGGADEFLDFIEQELKPAVAAEYKVDPRRQALFGHSLGGLLALHALFTRPDSFETFAAVSSSIWWNARYVLEEQQAFAAALAQTPTQARLLLSVGGDELPDMVEDSERLNVLLQPLRARGLQLQFARIEGEDHVTVAPPAFNRLLKLALKATPADVAAYQDKLPPETKAPVFTDPAAYLALTPAERTRIRIDVRRMSKEERAAYNARMYALIHQRMSAEQRAMLKAEKEIEDRRNGTVTVED